MPSNPVKYEVVRSSRIQIPYYVNLTLSTQKPTVAKTGRHVGVTLSRRSIMKQGCRESK